MEREEVHRKRGQGWTSLGHLKTGQDGKMLLRSDLWYLNDLARILARLNLTSVHVLYGNS